MLRAVDALKTLNHFFRSLGAVDREQFHTFATAMLETNPSIRSFSFQRLLTQAERPAYEAAMRKHYPDFSIGKWVDGKRIPVGPMRSYRVVDYLEPMQGNGVAFGLDASSIPKQFDAMQRYVIVFSLPAQRLVPTAGVHFPRAQDQKQDRA